MSRPAPDTVLALSPLATIGTRQNTFQMLVRTLVRKAAAGYQGPDGHKLPAALNLSKRGLYYYSM